MFEMDWPEHWEIAKLGDKAELKNGINFKKEQKGQGISTVDVLNMYSDGIYLDISNLYRVDYKIKDRDLLRTNDILFVRSSLKQEGVAWASLFGGHEDPMTFCGFLIRARLTTLKINHEFLTHYFRSDFARRFLISKSARLAITNISQAILSSCPIPLPPLPEQRAIAHVLQTIQEAKAARQRELALERERKAALMDYLFSHGTKDEPRKQTEIGEIPESWEVVRLEDVCTFTTGKLNSEQATADGQYPFFTCSQETFRIDSYSFDQEAMLLAGNNARGIYSVKYYKGRFDAYQRTYVITIEDTKRLSYQYFLYDLFLRLELLRRQSIGATTKYLTAPIIKNLGLALPPPSEQLMISSVFWSCDEKIAALEQEAERLDELFHAMLDELMTGQRSAVPLIDSELLS